MGVGGGGMRGWRCGVVRADTKACCCCLPSSPRDTNAQQQRQAAHLEVAPQPLLEVRLWRPVLDLEQRPRRRQLNGRGCSGGGCSGGRRCQLRGEGAVGGGGRGRWRGAVLPLLQAQLLLAAQLDLLGLCLVPENESSRLWRRLRRGGRCFSRGSQGAMERTHGSEATRPHGKMDGRSPLRQLLFYSRAHPLKKVTSAIVVSAQSAQSRTWSCLVPAPRSRVARVMVSGSHCRLAPCGGWEAVGRRLEGG